MLGFSIKSLVSDVAHVATDPRAQALVAAGAQAYAPESTAQVVSATQQALSKYRGAKRFIDRSTGKGRGHGPRMMPEMPPPEMNMEPDGGPIVAPVQHSNILPLAIGGGALVLILVMLKR